MLPRPISDTRSSLSPSLFNFIEASPVINLANAAHRRHEPPNSPRRLFARAVPYNFGGIRPMCMPLSTMMVSPVIRSAPSMSRTMTAATSSGVPGRPRQRAIAVTRLDRGVTRPIAFAQPLAVDHAGTDRVDADLRAEHHARAPPGKHGGAGGTDAAGGAGDDTHCVFQFHGSACAVSTAVHDTGVAH